ncbi:MAG: RNA polymerase sigma factor RpoD, partial [uncultured Cytophagales bacterium]
ETVKDHPSDYEPGQLNGREVFQRDFEGGTADPAGRSRPGPADQAGGSAGSRKTGAGQPALRGVGSQAVPPRLDAAQRPDQRGQRGPDQSPPASCGFLPTRSV